MNNLKQYIFEKLKVNSNSKVHKELDTLEDFAKKYGGEYSKYKIIFKDGIFYDNALTLITSSTAMWLRKYKRLISVYVDSTEYFLLLKKCTSFIMGEYESRNTAEVVSHIMISKIKGNIEVSWAIKTDKSTEQIYLKILQNIVDAKFK